MFPKNKYVQNLHWNRLQLFFLCFYQIHTILDEMIFGGQVLETSSTELVKAVEEISRCPMCVFVCEVEVCLRVCFCTCIMITDKALFTHDAG